MGDTANDAAETKNGSKATATTSKSSAWEERFKEVVWAKSGSFPWWPSYIFDPKQLSQSEEGYAKAQKLNGKQYVVLFYADRTLGFVSPKDIKPFNEQTIETYSGQKISNKYKAQFPKAIAAAKEDYILSPDDRLQWYFEAQKEESVVPDEFDDNEEASYFEEDDAAAASLGFEFDEKEEALIKSPKSTKRKRSEVSAEEEDAPPEPESESDHDDLSDRFSDEEDQPKKKKRIYRRKKVSDTASDHGDAGVAVAAVAEKKRARKPRDKSTSETMSTKEKPAVASSSAKKAPALPAEESKLERLTRLAGILQLTTHPKDFDGKRALKTLDKISEVNDISREDFVKSDVLAAVKAARKSHDADVRQKANDLWETWKRKNGAADAPPPPPPSATSSESAKNGIAPSLSAASIARTPSADAMVSGAVKNATPAAPAAPVVKPLSLERTRAVRMLKDVLSDHGLASRLEEYLHSTYGSITGSPRYFEAVTRIFYALRTSTLHLTDIIAFLDGVDRSDGSANGHSLAPLIDFHPNSIDM